MSASILTSSNFRRLVRKVSSRLRDLTVGALMVCIAAQSAFADPVTYQQLRQEQGGRGTTTASVPKVARTNDQQEQGQGGTQQGQAQQGQAAGTAQESPTPPEFVRLPDGRIVRYGPGIVCDENCVEPIAPAAFRGPGPSLWWIVPPIVAGGILCIVLCRPDRDLNPLPSPTIVIPSSPLPTVSPIVSPTIAPSPSPTATPVAPIPEPGTLLLFGAGLGALLARRRRAAKKQQM